MHTETSSPIATLHQARVELGWHAWLTTKQPRAPVLGDVKVGLQVIAWALPKVRSEATRNRLRNMQTELASIAIRAGARGGVLGMDALTLRGCLCDLAVELA